MDPIRRSPAAPTLAALALLLLAPACARLGGPGGSDAGISVTTVPTPPAYVSGGQTLVRIDAPADVDLADLTVTVNGRDATAGFRASPPDWLDRPGHSLLGLVDGLVDGENTVVAALGDEEAARLSITNYPITGPIFSGERLEPYLCLSDLAPDRSGEPRRFAIGNGDFLEGPPRDADCTYPTRVDHVYRATVDGEEEWLPLESLADLPADVAMVTTSLGRSVPFVVRIETGTINRAIYQTAILADPSVPEPTPWDRPSGWNGRLVYTYGGGCEAGFFQGPSTGGVLRESFLAAGYAVASSTLNVNAQGGCNDPLSAETTLMVKERFAETYGPPVYTIGNGGSGGAMQQLLIAGAYPGILDGILPSMTFPDAVSYLIDSVECYPLRQILNDEGISEEERRLIGGWARWYTCDTSLGERPNRSSPYDCPDLIPAARAYDAEANPRGIRCSVYDGMRAVFGTRVYPETGDAGVAFGRSPHDNVGVQYGLEALREGLISKELFLDVNERIGGWDIDFTRTPARTVGDPAAIRAAYETGRITSGTGGLAQTPIIDERAYLDDTGNFHTSYYSFVMRERLIRDLGRADHYVLQRHAPGISLADENVAAMDAWLAALARDGSSDPVLDRIARARPASLTDACWDADGTRVDAPQTFDTDRLFDNRGDRCNQLYPPHAGPRMVAGGPLTNDVFKCQLKPLDHSDYPVEFSDEEWARLEAVFPEGVCDWSKPGVGQVAQVGTWLSFGPSPVNRYAPEGR